MTGNGSPWVRVGDRVLAIDVPEDPDVDAPMTSRLAHLALIDALGVALAVTKGPTLLPRLARIKDVVRERRLPD